MKVKVRFAPSPTGYLHIGGARTALFNWLYAQRMKGKFVLRIEDTDVERSRKEFVDDIIEGINWLGMTPDEGPYFQSERLERYREIAFKLLEEGKAYRCYCTPEELEARRKEALKKGLPPRYDGRCRNIEGKSDRPFAIRFMTPREGVTAVDDLIRGRTVFQNVEIEDFVLLRTNGMPTYNLCVVVDDRDMGITHVIRGEDHLTNTPKQILLYRALSWEVPVFAHVPLILGPDRTRLSKRHGATALLTYREEGYLPEAMINFLVRLGWSHGDQEFFTVDELIKIFDIKDIGKSPAVFNVDKLRWLNQEHMKLKSSEELYHMVKPFLESLGVTPRMEDGYLYLLNHIKVRAKTLKEVAEMSAFYFSDEIKYDEKGASKFFDEKGKEGMRRVLLLLEKVDMEDEKKMEEEFRKICDELGIKLVHLAQAVRLALTGKTVSPGIFDVMKALGKEKVILRIKRALHH